MINTLSDRQLSELTDSLMNESGEWSLLEFKKDNANPEQIAKNISAIANAAALEGRECGYILWGVDDKTHEIVGTRFDPDSKKKGNVPFKKWLHQVLENLRELDWTRIPKGEKRLTLCKVGAAREYPVSYNGTRYIRIGAATAGMDSDTERKLWDALRKVSFEDGIAAEYESAEDVLNLLDYEAYFHLQSGRLPERRRLILDGLAQRNIITARDGGGWGITNLGALLFARDLSDFSTVAYKKARVIQYHGGDRASDAKEHRSDCGYAAGFEKLIAHVSDCLTKEKLINGVRKPFSMFPEVVIRELIANALIHQDLNLTGAAPLVEIFPDRVEIGNPGAPIVPADRFVDAVKSRNEKMAHLMYVLGICEMRGSGIDKIILSIEKLQLPAPLFEKKINQTSVTLLAHKDVRTMSKAERTRACYLHACIRYLSNSNMTNSSLRARFGVSAKKAADVSRYIADALEAGMIVLTDPAIGTKGRSYLPYWAKSDLLAK